MKKIPLTRGFVALIDDADYPAVSQYRWHALVTATGVYAIGRPYPTRGRQRPNLPEGPKTPLKKKLLHRFLLGLGEDETQVDHRNQDTLDNRRKNLRVGTAQQNRCNRPKRAGTSSVYKGVTWNAASSLWHAKITAHRRCLYVGAFDDERKAALAYDRAASSYHGEFAFFNFPTLKQRLRGWLHASDIRNQGQMVRVQGA